MTNYSSDQGRSAPGLGTVIDQPNVSSVANDFLRPDLHPLSSVSYFVYLIFTFLVGFRMTAHENIARDLDALDLSRVLRLAGFGLIGLYAALSILAEVKPRQVLSANPAKWTLAYMLLAGASTFWSVSPLYSAYRLGELAIMCLFMAVFVRQCHGKIGLRQCVVYVVAPIILTGFLNGTLGAGTSPDMTVFARYKANGASMAAGLLTLCGLDAVLRSRAGGRHWPHVLIVAIGVSFTVLFHSAAALLGLYLCAGYLVWKHRPRALLRWGPAALAVSVLIFWSTWGSAVGILGGAIDKDPETILTLSGRARLWERVLQFSTEKPILGHGFSSIRFLIVDEAEINWAVEISHPHSGYLAALVSLGAVGAIALLWAFWRTWRQLPLLATEERHIASCAFLFLAMMNLSEPVVGDMYHTLWPAWCALACWIAVALPGGSGRPRPLGAERSGVAG